MVVGRRALTRGHFREILEHLSYLLEPIAIKLSPHDPYPVSMRSNRAFKGRTNERPKDRRRSDRDRRIQLARSLLVILSQSVVLGDTSADDSHSM